MDTKPMIEKLINGLREGRDLTGVAQDLAADHRTVLAKWSGVCVGIIAEDMERMARYLSWEIPYRATMFEDVCIVMRAAIPGIVACDYATSSKRHRRMVEMMYWAMFGYGEFLNASIKHYGRSVPVGHTAGMATMIHATSALGYALRMVDYATRGKKPEDCARLARDAVPAFVRTLGQARDNAAHVYAAVNGEVYAGAFGDDGQLLRVGSAAQELFESMRSALIDILDRSIQAPATPDPWPTPSEG